MKRALLFSILLAAPCAFPAGPESVDLSTVNRIKTEAFQNSKVMDHAFYLTDVYGPRLAGSANYRKAAEWAVKQLKEWGLANAQTEPWGLFGRGWNWSRATVNMLSPQPSTLNGVPLAWAPGTAGAVTADALFAPMADAAEGEKYKGKLKGKIVLIDAMREMKPHFEADARRLGDTELASRAEAPDPADAGPRKPQPAAEREAARVKRNKLLQFLKDEGVVALLTTGQGGDDGTIFAASGGSREVKDPLPPPMVALAAEHYNRLARLLEKQVPVKLELDVRAQIEQDAATGLNVVAEIPGGSKKDEIVMLGAHLDSWQAATGAADNAAGCAVVLEAVRILTALHVKMDRTVRIALWDAEEEGLIGSREYVKAHFADPGKMELKAEHSKLAGYFNFDNGSGKIRGVYLQGNDMLRPVFEAWLAPFKDLGAATVSIRNTGGTDHLAFDAVGLPGFQFIQDPLDYGSRVHHTNMDTYDRLQKSDLMEAAAIMASFVYNAATRPEMLPRKPLPAPRKSE
jgi:hypothetical protein